MFVLEDDCIVFRIKKDALFFNTKNYMKLEEEGIYITDEDAFFYDFHLTLNNNDFVQRIDDVLDAAVYKTIEMSSGVDFRKVEKDV